MESNSQAEAPVKFLRIYACVRIDLYLITNAMNIYSVTKKNIPRDKKTWPISRCDCPCSWYRLSAAAASSSSSLLLSSTAAERYLLPPHSRYRIVMCTRHNRSRVSVDIFTDRRLACCYNNSNKDNNCLRPPPAICSSRANGQGT